MFNTGWTITGDEVRVNIPFAKVNKERRTVSGFATLDNVDTHGDTIDADASVDAFSRFRGNIREMHQPIAVGKVVDFVPQELDDGNGNTYKGIYVTAYISKGAPDTWEKVIDGTLGGFSVAGAIKKKEASKDVPGGSIIKEYDLHELSLVDNPANPLANVFSVQKMGDTTVASGIAVETTILNILYNKEDDLVILSDKEERDGFENIGWVEDTEESTEKIASTVQEYKEKYLEGSIDNKLSTIREAWYKSQRSGNRDGYEYVLSVFDTFVVTQDEEGNYYKYNYSETDDGITFSDRTEIEVKTQITEKSASGWSITASGNAVLSSNDFKMQSSETSSLNKHTEGGANVATDNNNEETVEEVEETKVEKTVDNNDEKTEKAADISEGPTSEVDVDAIVKAVSDSVTEAVTKVAEESAKSAEETKDSVNEALEEVKKTVEERLNNFDERLTTVEGGTAVKKSADEVENDDDSDEDDKEESFWRGGFLGTKDLVK